MKMHAIYFPSSEHAYQWRFLKYNDQPDLAEEVLKALSLGSILESVCFDIMKDAVYLKHFVLTIAQIMRINLTWNRLIPL